MSTHFHTGDVSVEEDTTICFFFFFSVCEILVPQPGIEPVPPAGEAWHLNHWTSREVYNLIFLCESSSELVFLAFRCNKYSIEKKYRENIIALNDRSGTLMTLNLVLKNSLKHF